MIWIRVFITILVVIMLIYYAMLILQIVGLIKFTNRDIRFSRAVVPFWYWIMPENEPKKTKKPSK